MYCTTTKELIAGTTWRVTCSRCHRSIVTHRPEHQFVCPGPAPLPLPPPFVAAPTIVEAGPGTELHSLLGYLGFRACRRCIWLAKIMNQWGPAACRENLSLILRRLKRHAARRSVPYFEPVAKRLVLLAIRRAERRACSLTAAT